MTERRFGAAPCVLLALAVLSGCSGAGPSPAVSPSATGLPEGVEVALVQLRADVAPRQAQVQIRNQGGQALQVGAVRVEDPRFAGAAERVVVRESTVPAGGAVDVRVQLPAMDCSAADDGAATVVLELDGVEVDAPIPDTLGFVPALHARECLAERLAEVAAVEITGFTPAPAGQAGSLELAVRPTGEGTAHLGEVDSTPLLMYALGGPATPYDLALDVGAGSAATAVEVPLVPQRCDPHVVQEDKRGTIFTIDVVVDGVAGEIDVAAPPELKARMLTWVAEWCGFGGDEGIDPPPND